MGFLGVLFEFIRDLAVLAAAVGIAKWAWDQHSQAPRLRDAQALAGIEAERTRADLKQWGARMEALGIDLSTRLEEIALRTRVAEERAALEARIHRLLQTTRDPFLTFAEIRDGLANASPEAGASVAAIATTEGLQDTEETLRRALIELIADDAIAQLDHDRYFIASDFEAEQHNE